MSIINGIALESDKSIHVVCVSNFHSQEKVTKKDM